MLSAHSGSAECGVTSQRWQNESLAAPFGAARLSMIVASAGTRGPPEIRRGALDPLYCGKNNVFTAEGERAAPLLSVRRPRLCRSLSQLIRHLGDAGHGAFLVAF